MTTRDIVVPYRELLEIKEKGRKKGIPLNRLINMMGRAGFKSSLYRQCALRVNEEELEILEDIVKRKLKTLADDYNIDIVIEKNNDAAELVGLFLGDGCLVKYNRGNAERHRYQHSISLTFNRNEEEVIEHAKCILKKVIGIDYVIGKGKGTVVLRYQRKNVFDALVNIGLTPGNKIKNQVSIPLWIMEKEDFMIACARGLIDTDGCVCFRRTKKHNCVQVSFVSHSRPLLMGLKSICDFIGVRSSISNAKLSIDSKKDVLDFLNKVNPYKWEELQKKEGDLSGKFKYKCKVHDYTNIGDVVKEKGGKILSEYVSARTKIWFECNGGHRWMATPYSIVIAGNWCPICAKENMIDRNRKMSCMKFNVSKEDLEKLVWEKPTVEIAKDFGVSDSAIAKRCKKYGIKKPPRGYWAKKVSGIDM